MEEDWFLDLPEMEEDEETATRFARNTLHRRALLGRI
jgi:hypothetical protein